MTPNGIDFGRGRYNEMLVVATAGSILAMEEEDGATFAAPWDPFPLAAKLAGLGEREIAKDYEIMLCRLVHGGVLEIAHAGALGWARGKLEALWPGASEEILQWPAEL